MTNLLQQSKKERGDLLMEQKNLRQPLSKEALEVRYEKLTLKDDFMFGKVMQDERNFCFSRSTSGNAWGSRSKGV